MTTPSRQFSLFKITGQRLLLGLSALLLVLCFSFFIDPIINIDLIGWASGFSHPLQGWDHLLTMLAVGIWAAQLRGKAIWLLPLSFVGVMSLGGMAGTLGFALPSVEIIILLSGLVFSFLITRRVRFSTKINVLIVAFFGFFHGYAHGQEISTSASLFSYTLGFMVATLLLHGAGILTARLIVLAFALIFTTSLFAAPVGKLSNAKATVISQTGHPYFSAFESNNLDSLFVKDKRSEPDKTCRWPSKNRVESSSSVQSLRCAHHQGSYRQKIADTAQIKPYKSIATPCFSVAINPGKNVFDTVDIVISFSLSYPAINNSPGICFLSNGVGLNSPPAIVSRYSKSPFAALQTRTPPLEEVILHFSCPDFNFKKLPSSIRHGVVLFKALAAKRFPSEPNPYIHQLTRNHRGSADPISVFSTLSRKLMSIRDHPATHYSFSNSEHFNL